MSRASVGLAFATIALLGGCEPSDRAVDPAWGKQPCDHCAMVVSDRRFAGEITTASGERFFFDDPGCMVVFAEEHGLASARAWVRSPRTSAWIDARGARYESGAATPMDFGFAPAEGGAVAWDDARARILAAHADRADRKAKR